MVKIFGLEEIEAKKRALVAESEVYRQTLLLEVHNIRLYTVRRQRTFTLWRLASPLFMVAAGLLGSRLIGGSFQPKGRGKWSRILGVALIGWRLWRRYGPALQDTVFQRIFSGPKPGAATPGEQTPAANS